MDNFALPSGCIWQHLWMPSLREGRWGDRYQPLVGGGPGCCRAAYGAQASRALSSANVTGAEASTCSVLCLYGKNNHNYSIHLIICLTYALCHLLMLSLITLCSYLSAVIRWRIWWPNVVGTKLSNLYICLSSATASSPSPPSTLHSFHPQCLLLHLQQVSQYLSQSRCLLNCGEWRLNEYKQKHREKRRNHSLLSTVLFP